MLSGKVQFIVAPTEEHTCSWGGLLYLRNKVIRSREEGGDGYRPSILSRTDALISQYSFVDQEVQSATGQRQYNIQEQ